MFQVTGKWKILKYSKDEGGVGIGGKQMAYTSSEIQTMLHGCLHISPVARRE